MTDNIKTYVITSPSQTSLSWSLGPTGLTGYDGFFYSIAGAGGVGGTYNSTLYAGSGGFIQSGYVDLTYPYNVDNITVSINTNSKTTLSIGYTGPNIDPTNGVSPFVLTADEGKIYEKYPVNGGGLGDDKVICGFYAPGNRFDYDTNPVRLINQRTVLSNSINNPDFTGGPYGAISSAFGQELFPVIQAGGGFYAGGTGIFGLTGPFGFTSGGYTLSNEAGDNLDNQSINSTGYAIISLIPTSMIINNNFFNIAGSTGTYTGNTGLYLYSMLGGGGGGAGSSSVGGGGGGAGVYECGILSSNTGIIDYNVGLGGLGGDDSDQYGNGGDTYITLSEEPLLPLVAAGAEGPVAIYGNGGDGFFTGGYNVNYWEYQGNSYINMPSNTSQTADGAGFVNQNYGQYNAGGGGGGPYGGNGNGTLGGATGYGCGGGGGNPLGGAGTGGYIILKNISSPTINFYKITSNTTFDFLSLYPYTGFWFFLNGNGLFGTTSFDTGHFLIKEDNVRQILATTNGSRFTIKVNFGTLYNQPQQYSLIASGDQYYMSILFYA